jgi:signal transduction histidine kinase
MTDAESPEPRDPGRDHFLATMSHDIRTPLTALRGALGLLEGREVRPEMAQQLIAMLRRSSTRLERLVFGLLAMDQIDNGSLNILREVVDLRDLVGEAAAATRREHQLIEVDLPGDAIEVVCDRERTLQALDHLLDNARKYGGEHGTIRISLERKDSFAAVRISDEGPGIPTEERERIFERYLQIGERLPNEPRGVGIGLYLARWNATAMGGSVDIADAGPGTTTLELRLPLVPPGA